VRVVKRWDGLHSKWYLVQSEDGAFAWKSKTTGWVYAKEAVAAWLTCWGEGSDVGRAISGTLPPTWEEGKTESGRAIAIIPAATSRVRCPHDGTKQIRDYAERWDPYVIKGGQRMQRYTSPLAEQMVAIENRLVAMALRSLPEVPLCSVSGQRVNVVARFSAIRNTYYATFMCDACAGGEKP
jgi:hypothetical protein